MELQDNFVELVHGGDQTVVESMAVPLRQMLGLLERSIYAHELAAELLEFLGMVVESKLRRIVKSRRLRERETNKVVKIRWKS